MLPAAIAASAARARPDLPGGAGRRGGLGRTHRGPGRRPTCSALINHFRGTQVLTPPEPGGIADRPGRPRPGRRARHGDRQARAGDRRRGRAQPAAGRAARRRQVACWPRACPACCRTCSPHEALEVSMIHSVAGLLDGGRLVHAPAVPRAASRRLAGGADRRRPARPARRGQPRASRRAVPRRIAGIPPPGAGGAAPAAGNRAHHGRARHGARHLPGAVPVGRGDEPVPLRPSRRRRRANAAARRAAARTTRAGSAARCWTAST